MKYAGILKPIISTVLVDLQSPSISCKTGNFARESVTFLAMIEDPVPLVWIPGFFGKIRWKGSEPRKSSRKFHWVICDHFEVFCFDNHHFWAVLWTEGLNRNPRDLGDEHFAAEKVRKQMENHATTIWRSRGMACTSLQPPFWFVLVNLHLFCC